VGSEPKAQSPPVVLLDANLLYPFHLRNLLVQLGVHHIIAPRWTDAIHDEWIGSLVATGKATRERLIRTRDIMQRVLPEADVRGYEHRIADLTLPDPRDRHVLAAAIHAGAEVLLTFNLKDFPADVAAPFGLIVTDPDTFLCGLFTADPEAVLAAVDAARMNLSRTTPSAGAFIDALARQRLVGLASRLRSA
jgi:hypothetical protein